VDDIADEDAVPIAQRAAALSQWRAEVKGIYDGAMPSLPVLRELRPVIARYRLPYALFDELLLGVESDLVVTRYATWPELEQYCYRVASVVGLLSIEIFGYTQPACRDYAVHLGKALQLTNILRDVKNDGARGRIYLPLEAMVQFEVSPEEVLAGRYSDRYRRLAAHIADRARQHYRAAREVLPSADRQAMATAELMGSVYWRILHKVEQGGFDVFGANPARLSKGMKLFLILRMWLRSNLGAWVPSYGTS
jgi:15-cis-phytoene synthase